MNQLSANLKTSTNCYCVKIFVHEVRWQVVIHNVLENCNKGYYKVAHLLPVGFFYWKTFSAFIVVHGITVNAHS